MDSHQHLHFNFAFIDEVYKIDNSFVIDQETSGENERDTAYRLAFDKEQFDAYEKRVDEQVSRLFQ